MNHFVVFAKGQTDVSFINVLSGARSPGLVGHSKHTRDALAQIAEAQLVVIDSRNAANDAMELLHRLRNKASDLSTLVILGTVPMWRYENAMSGTWIYYFRFLQVENGLRSLLSAPETNDVRSDQENYI